MPADREDRAARGMWEGQVVLVARAARVMWDAQVVLAARAVRQGRVAQADPVEQGESVVPAGRPSGRLAVPNVRAVRSVT